MSKCLGCGIKLQNISKDELGYTTNLETHLCERCFRLTNYGEYKQVSLNNNDYSKIINNIPKQSLVIYTSDLLSLNLSSLKDRSNTILVLTKYDILPKSTKEEKIISKLKQEYPNLLDIICISSIKNYNIDKLYNLLIKHSNNNPIYLVGSTNSGKSTLLNKLIKNYTNNDIPNITVSMYPSTTLDKIEIKLNNLTIIDTPGLIEEGNLTNFVSPKELKQITPKKEIKPRSCQVIGEGSLMIDTFARIDYDSKEVNSFVIYTAQAIKTSFISYEKNTYRDLNSHKYSLNYNEDIVIPGLGFIKFTKPINITIYTKENITTYKRNNLI